MIEKQENNLQKHKGSTAFVYTFFSLLIIAGLFFAQIRYLSISLIVIILYIYLLLFIVKFSTKLKPINRYSLVGAIVGLGTSALFVFLSISKMINLNHNIANFIFNNMSFPALWLAYCLGFDGCRGIPTLLFCFLFYYTAIGYCIGIIVALISKLRDNN